MISPEILKEVKKIAEKNPAVQSMLEFYELVSRSPYLDSYLTLYYQIKDLNQQLKITTEGGRIDLFDWRR